MRKPALLCLRSLLLSCFCVVQLTAAEKGWVQAETPHFLLISNGSESTARNVAAGFERMHTLFATVEPNLRTESTERTIVFAPKDEATMKLFVGDHYRNGNTLLAGLYVNGWEQDYAIVRLDLLGDGLTSVYHEYTHKLLHMNFTRMPKWLDEGMAEFFSTVQFRDKEVLLGLSTRNSAFFRLHAEHSIERLVDPPPGSLARMEGNDILEYYAESWALTHFLILSREMGNGQRFTAYQRLLQSGTDSRKAFEQAIGPFKDVQKMFDSYTSKFTLPTGSLSQPITIDPSSIGTKNLSNADTQAILSGYFVREGQPDEAEKRLTEALKEDATSKLAHQSMAFLDFVRGKKPEAQAEFDQALAISPDYRSFYYRSMIAYDGKEDPDSLAALDAAMQKISTLNPRFAPAFVVQSRIYTQQKKLDAALQAAVAARNLQPDRAGYWTNIAAILFLAHDYPNSIRIGDSVVSRWEGPDGAEALGIVERARRASAAQVTPQEQEAETQAMKYAVNLTSVDGFVESISCEKEKVTEVVLRSGDETMKFRPSKGYGMGWSDTLWMGSDHFRICYFAKGMKATVRYDKSSDASVQGDMKWIELRDDLIPEIEKPTSAN